MATPTTSPLPNSLHILIIGSGPCGLATSISTSLAGHRATIFESASRLQEVGAGMQITPNGSRLLERWGIMGTNTSTATDGDGNKDGDVGAKPDVLRIQRYSGKLLAERRGYVKEVREHYGSPLWGIHRGDLQTALVRRAKEVGVEIRLGGRVLDVDFEGDGEGKGEGKGVAVLLESGERVSGDLIVAADGLWSATRSLFLGKESQTQIQPKPTGHMAYRILVPVEQVNDEDWDLKEWMATSRNNLWIGPDAHAVAYSIRRGTLLNIVVLLPDDLAQDAKREKGDIEELRRRLGDWDPILTRYLACVRKVEKWRLYHLPPLPRWRSPSGTFLMAGDACHAILPYMAQGANSALEDAGVLGALLSRVGHVEQKQKQKQKHQLQLQLQHATRLYESMRQERTRELHRLTWLQGEELHLGDGMKQKERDEWFARSFLERERQEDGNGNGNGDGDGRCWTHPKWQQWIWGYDAYDVVNKALLENPFPFGIGF